MYCSASAIDWIRSSCLIDAGLMDVGWVETGLLSVTAAAMDRRDGNFSPAICACRPGRLKPCPMPAHRTGYADRYRDRPDAHYEADRGAEPAGRRCRLRLGAFGRRRRRRGLRNP